ncbi:uncharacterized protein LOC117106475, partial [Anneissia japonica]|uniref:uncharacterized protein LOC117106475 n=1 Tax=Anneissia japonica TaxID=1529436 RepID=UPI00142567BD
MEVAHGEAATTTAAVAAVSNTHTQKKTGRSEPNTVDTKTPTLYIPDTTVESDGDLSITTLNLTLTSPGDTTVDSSEITNTSSRQVQLTFNLTEDTTKLALIDEPNSITISARIFEIIATDGPIIVNVNLTVVEESTLFKTS